MLAPPSSAGSGWVARIGQLGFATAIAVLLVGAGAVALLSTDSGCWAEYPTPTGVRIEVGPWATGEISIPGGATSVSCSNGLISVRGAGLGALLATTALGLVFLAARRREPAGSPPADDALAV